MYSPSTCSHLIGRRKGIGRINVIVVILLISILTAIVLPAICVTRLAFAQVSCADNLREIGSAYRGFANAHNGDSSKLQSNHSDWMEQIRKHLNRGSTSLHCRYEEPLTGKRLPEASYYVRDHIFKDDYELKVPISDDSSRMRLSQRAECPNGFAIEMEATAGLGFRWFYDFNDLIITLQPQPDRSVKLTAVLAITSPYCFDLYDGYGQLLAYDFGPNSENNTYTFGPDTPGLRAFSYGMNAAAKSFSKNSDGNKVLIAEYTKPVCNVTNIPLDKHQLSGTDFWPTDCAPRHNGNLNVLFMNGAVKTLSPRDIDPRRNALAKEYWLPTAFKPEVP